MTQIPIDSPCSVGRTAAEHPQARRKTGRVHAAKIVNAMQRARAARIRASALETVAERVLADSACPRQVPDIERSRTASSWR